MKKEDFKIGDVIDTEVYTYADSEIYYTRKVKGTVYQITDAFVVIDNGYYKESFQYREFVTNDTPTVLENPYELDVETYANNIVDQCVKDFKAEGEGYVFNYNQASKVIEKISPEEYRIDEEENIYYIRRKNYVKPIDI